MIGKFDRTKLAEEIIARLEKGQSPESVSKTVAAYLIDSNKTSEVNSLIRDCIDMRARHKGIVELNATTAFPITPQQEAQIQSLAKSIFDDVNKVIIHKSIDEDVIGGINLSFANSNLDLTVRGKLNKLRALVS